MDKPRPEINKDWKTLAINNYHSCIGYGLFLYFFVNHISRWVTLHKLVWVTKPVPPLGQIHALKDTYDYVRV